nr:hypothetical protein [Kibdelosporangium sp. MJ126-NF4]CTQ91550.1 hypothetical protein [Kibdelosporangium sp. MJ126-NF4]
MHKTPPGYRRRPCSQWYRSSVADSAEPVAAPLDLNPGWQTARRAVNRR